MRHLITPNDLSDHDVKELFEDARLFSDLTSNNILDGKLIVHFSLKAPHEQEVVLR